MENRSGSMVGAVVSHDVRTFASPFTEASFAIPLFATNVSFTRIFSAISRA